MQNELALEPKRTPTEITIGVNEHMVVILFPKPLAYIGLTAREARIMAQGLLERADELDRIQDVAAEVRH